MTRSRRLLLIVSSIVFLGCSKPALVCDLAPYPQDTLVYVRHGEKPVISDAKQNAFVEIFLKNYFKPWTQDYPADRIQNIKHDEFALIKKYQRHPGFGEDRQPYERLSLDAIVTNMQMKSFPNQKLSAITIKATNLRVLPTELPRFKDWNEPGEGYPFDYLQSSMIAPNTPVFSLQTTRDGLWSLVVTPRTLGWIHTDAIAYTDRAFQQKWQAQAFVVATRDGVPLLSSNAVSHQVTRIGALYPLFSETPKTYQIAIAGSDEKDNAVFVTATIDKSKAQKFPLPLTEKNIARITNNFLGTPYGWGDMFGMRDCSSTLADLFTSFGVWLPRTSTQQEHYGKYTSLKGLTNGQKIKIISEHGKPFFTIIHKHKHTMLYLGNYRGKIMVLQDTWGLPSRSLLGNKGREIVGKTVISPLDLGAGHMDIPESYLDLTDGMVVLTPKTNLPRDN